MILFLITLYQGSEGNCERNRFSNVLQAGCPFFGKANLVRDNIQIYNYVSKIQITRDYHFQNRKSYLSANLESATDPSEVIQIYYAASRTAVTINAFEFLY